MPSLKHSSKTPSQGKDYSDDNRRDSPEEFGISSQQFQIIFSNLTRGGIALCQIVYDEKGVPVDFIVLEANSSFEAIFGVKREQIILKKATQFDHEIKESFADYIGMYGRVATTGMPEVCEVYFQPQDKCYQVYAYSPKKDYVIAVFIDVTARKNAEQQFIMSEKRFRRLYETIQDGIMARDLQGQMIDCNNAYAKMLGYSKKELRRLTAQQLLPEKWYEQREKIVNNVLQTGRSIVFEENISGKMA